MDLNGSLSVAVQYLCLETLAHVTMGNVKMRTKITVLNNAQKYLKDPGDDSPIRNFHKYINECMGIK